MEFSCCSFWKQRLSSCWWKEGDSSLLSSRKGKVFLVPGMLQPSDHVWSSCWPLVFMWPVGWERFLWFWVVGNKTKRVKQVMTWKLYEFRLPTFIVPINKVLLVHAWINKILPKHSFVLCVGCGCFHATRQNLVLATETTWPASSHIYDSAFCR